MNINNTPKKIDDGIMKFCETIASNSIPEYVPVHPESWCIAFECYDNVERKVKECGGMRQLGWRIQAIPDPFPKYMVEAVHHAIWISESGKKIDITPQSHSASKIVFLPDDLTKLGKYRIGEKYYALFDCPIVNEYVRLCNLESSEYFSKTKSNKQPRIPSQLTRKQQELQAQILMKYSR